METSGLPAIASSPSPTKIFHLQHACIRRSVHNDTRRSLDAHRLHLHGRLRHTLKRQSAGGIPTKIITATTAVSAITRFLERPIITIPVAIILAIRGPFPKVDRKPPKKMRIKNCVGVRKGIQANCLILWGHASDHYSQRFRR